MRLFITTIKVASVQSVEQALLVAPVQLARALGLVDSAELIVLGREVVRQIAEEVEVGRAVAVVGRRWRRRRRRRRVHRFTIEIAVIAVRFVVTVGLAGTSWWRDNRRGGSCDRCRGCRHSGCRERIGGRDVAVGDAGRLPTLMNVQLTCLLVIRARMTLAAAWPIVAGTGMHRRLMSDITLGGVLLRVLLLLLDVVEVAVLTGHDGVAVRRQVLPGSSMIRAAGRITRIIPGGHVAIVCALVIRRRRISLTGTIGVGSALHTSVISVIGWSSLRIPIVLSGAAVLQLLLMELLHVSGSVH